MRHCVEAEGNYIFEFYTKKFYLKNFFKNYLKSHFFQTT